MKGPLSKTWYHWLSCNWEANSDLIYEACHLNINSLCHVSLNCGLVIILGAFFHFIRGKLTLGSQGNFLTSPHNTFCPCFSSSLCFTNYSQSEFQPFDCSTKWMHLFPFPTFKPLWCLKTGQTADVEKERRGTRASKESSRVM